MNAAPVCHAPRHRPPRLGGGRRLPHFGVAPICPCLRPAGGRSYRRASCRSRVRKSIRAWPGSEGTTSGRTTLRKAKPPSNTPNVLPRQALAFSRAISTSSSHLVRKTTGGPFSAAGSWVLRKYSRPATGRKWAGWFVLGSRAPVTTQLWARTVLARLGQRAEYSWNVQVPHTSLLL